MTQATTGMYYQISASESNSQHEKRDLNSVLEKCRQEFVSTAGMVGNVVINKRGHDQYPWISDMMLVQPKTFA